MAPTRDDTNPSPRAKPARPRLDDLSLAERTCLALVDEGLEHGWAIGSALAPDTELGRVWSLSRPLTYRALEQLTAKDLVRRDGTQGAQGRERVLVSCSPAGRRLARAWLDAPVEHLRDVRTELVLKLALRRRRGLDLAPVLLAQQAAFEPLFAALATAGPEAEIVDLWRRESARAVRRFLEAALEHEPGAAPVVVQPFLRLSARNQVRARVVSVSHGDVLSTVKTVLADGQVVTAVITRDAVRDLDIAPDDEVLVVVKSTEVMLAKP